MKTDDIGFLQYNIPLYYGNTDLLFKYYGPSGEYRENKEYIVINQDYLPPGTVKYSLNIGELENTTTKNDRIENVYRSKPNPYKLF